MPETAAPPAPPSNPVGQNLNDAFASLESMFQQPAKEAVKESPPSSGAGNATSSTEKKSQPQDGSGSTKEVQKSPSAKSTETSSEKDSEKSAGDTPAEIAPEQRPLKARDLKQKAEWAEADAKKWKAEYEKLKTESAKPKDDPEKKSLSERLEQLQKERDDYLNKLKFKAYEETPEYKEKWEKPFLDAYTTGRSKIAGIKVREGRNVSPDGEVLTEGTWRQGTAGDFDALMSIKDDETASDFAERVFGHKAAVALYHRERVNEINQGRLNAIQQYREKGSETEKLSLEQQQKMQKEVASTWQSENSALVEKYPHWFKSEEGDDKGNILLEKGMRLADLAFGGAPGMSPVEAAKLHSAVRSKAGGFDRLAYKYANAQKELKDLKAKLAEYEESEPKGGDTRKETTKVQRSDMEGVLASLDALAGPRR